MVEMIKLSPSILSANFANLEKDIKAAEGAGAPYIHIDVMDGHFVPNITFGPQMVSAIRKISGAVLDVHLMIENPEKYVTAFLEAGSDIITVHLESNPDMEFIYSEVKKYGKKLGITINPKTSVDELRPYLEIADMILIMSVNPGFGAQGFIEESIEKIRKTKQMAPDIDIEVDGGVKLDNVKRVIDAGANVIVAGSAIFGAEDIGKAVRDFIERCNG